MKFAPGQIVNLKSGGQPMTAVAADEDTVECIWLGEGGELFREPIPTLALERAHGSDEDDEADPARAAADDEDDDEDDDEEEGDEEDEDDDEDEDDEDEDEEARGEDQDKEDKEESDQSGAPRRRKRAVPA
jgi:uncharacterized protein YodC (DUF2158 family)